MDSQETKSKIYPSIVHKSKPMVTKAIILVGGRGTRLRPLTYTVPKPLICFCNKPILKYQIEKLVKAGINEIILALNYHSELIIEEVEKYQEEFGIRIIYSKEEIPLGTAGPLALARDHLENASFFVLNSDIACNVNLKNMIDEYMKTDALGTILTYEVEDPTRYGLINLEEGVIKSFLEKPTKIDGTGPWIINAGIYILSHKVLENIELRETSIETEIFPELARKGVLTTFKLNGYWMDIGQPADYLKGQKLAIQDMEDEGQNVDFDELSCSYEEGIVDKKNNVVIAKNVKIGSNVILKNCVIFEYSIIEDDVTVENSIIGWGSHLKKGSQVSDLCVLGEGTIVERKSMLKGHRTAEPNTRIEAEN